MSMEKVSKISVNLVFMGATDVDRMKEHLCWVTIRDRLLQSTLPSHPPKWKLYLTSICFLLLPSSTSSFSVTSQSTESFYEDMNNDEREIHSTSPSSKTIFLLYVFQHSSTGKFSYIHQLIERFEDQMTRLSPNTYPQVSHASNTPFQMNEDSYALQCFHKL